MQDRFKFRIWNGSEMHYNDFVVTATGFVAKLNVIYDVEYDNEKDEEKEIQSENEFIIDNSDLDFEKDKILMQCTGLKDKNGKLIYEGDIVNVKIDGWKTSYIPKVVVWNRKEWQLKQYNKNFKQNCSACEVKTRQKCQFCSQYFSATSHTNFKEFYNNEVIGNIYENPELLKDGE